MRKIEEHVEVFVRKKAGEAPCQGREGNLQRLFVHTNLQNTPSP